MDPVLEPKMRDSSKFSGGIAPLVHGRSRGWVCGVVISSYTLACRPGVHPARDRRQSPSVAISARIIDRCIGSSVCFNDRYVLARTAYLLSWCIGVNSIGISSGAGEGVEGTRVWSDCCKSPTEIRIACNDTAEAASVAVTNCKNASRVDTEQALHVHDQLLDIVHVPLQIVRRARARSTVLWIRLEACRATCTLNIDSDGVWICNSIAEPSLSLDARGCPTVAMECKDDRRRLVDVVVLWDVYEEGSGNVVGRSKAELYAWSVGGEIGRQRRSTSSTCGCNWSDVVGIRWEVSNQSCLVSTRICQARVRCLEIAYAANINSCSAARLSITFYHTVLDTGRTRLIVSIRIRVGATDNLVSGAARIVHVSKVAAV